MGWGGGGDQALIIIKGPMICFLHHLEERGSHLNEYQINSLKSLRRTFLLSCSVRTAGRGLGGWGGQRRGGEKRNTLKGNDACVSVRFEWTNKGDGALELIYNK